MELQAIRYAAMVSAMTFEQVVGACEAYLTKRLRPDAEEAAHHIREFLELPPDDESDISTEVRIMLVAGGFSREITTAVLWLNRFDGMDIRCVPACRVRDKWRGLPRHRTGHPTAVGRRLSSSDRKKEQQRDAASQAWRKRRDRAVLRLIAHCAIQEDSELTIVVPDRVNQDRKPSQLDSTNAPTAPECAGATRPTARSSGLLMSSLAESSRSSH